MTHPHPHIRAAQQRVKAPVVQTYHGTVPDVVRTIAPALPLYLMRPENIAENARRFLTAFPGDVAYAVKCNPDKTVLQTLYRNGVRVFDVASIDEIRAVRKVAPKAKLMFMHPVKSPEAIAEAYKTHGVRTFVLDSKDELYKIVRNTELAQDLELFVRLALPKNEGAAVDFSSKFGAGTQETVELLKLCRPVAVKLGVCFHAGHQTTDPELFKNAIRHVKAVIQNAGVDVDMLDTGGGFPVAYPDQPVPPLEAFIDRIKAVVADEGLGHMHLVCEPGRAMVANGASLVVRVEGRKGDLLYINDGTYGGLFDAGPGLAWRFDAQAVSSQTGEHRSCQGDLVPFRFAGPTCTTEDMMEGPFMLPADIQAGDWIELKNLGGYSQVFRSNFNGFGAYLRAVMAGK